jgi:AraC-like DNA-binding protein
MEPIALQRLRVLLPFTRFLTELGVSVETALERARMPLDLDGQKDAYVPIRLQVQFLHEMIAHAGVDDLGLRVAHRVGAGFVSDALRTELASAATLNQGLHVLSNHIYRESSLTRIWVVTQPPKKAEQTEQAKPPPCSCAGLDAIRVFHHGPVSFGTPVHRHMDWARTMLIIAVVRMFVGLQWMPTRIQLAGEGEPGNTACALFPQTRLTVSTGPGFVEFPTALLALPFIGEPPPLSTAGHSTAATTPGRDFTDSLICLMQTYLPSGYPSVEMAAELAGISKRSLQRRLRAQGTNYREVIQRARFELACHLLRDPGLRVLDVAYALGYEDPSNFGRSFRQIAGIGPAEFRRNPPTQETGSPPDIDTGPGDNSLRPHSFTRPLQT